MILSFAVFCFLFSASIPVPLMTVIYAAMNYLFSLTSKIEQSLFSLNIPESNNFVIFGTKRHLKFFVSPFQTMYRGS